MDKLIAVRGGQQLALSQLVQEGIFRGKFLDLGILRGIDFVLLGEESSEWETLLDEWEQSQDHLARKSCLERAVALKNRIPVPPALVYRESSLCQQAQDSLDALARKEREEESAFSKLQYGEQKDDANQLAWGASLLKGLCDRMTDERHRWTDSQIEELRPHYENARQRVVLLFSAWLSRQAPQSDAPAAVGEFKHRMLKLTGGNLNRLGLTELYERLESHTLDNVRRAETIAEVRQLLREVESWISSHGDALRLVRIATTRSLRSKGNEYARKLTEVAGQCQLPEIGKARDNLAAFMTKLQEADASVSKRAEQLWDSQISNEEDIDKILLEVEFLVAAYEGVQTDLEDLQLMRRVLRLYQKHYYSLSDDGLTWDAFEKLASEVKKNCQADFGQEELPWQVDVTIDGFVAEISKSREKASSDWLGALEEQATSIDSMPVDKANRLRDKASNPPPVIVEPHLKRATAILKKVEAHLDTLSVEWLIEKFKALTVKAKKEFLRRIEKSE
jgi:hypothetical protein